MNSAEKIAAKGLDFDNLNWIHNEGGPEFDYHIDYWLAYLGADLEAGTIDFLTKWAPNAYCHFHRHLGDTTTLVLQGEHHTIDMNDPDHDHKIRLPGSYSKKAAGELHMEYAGSEGAIVYFSMKEVDGKIFESLLGDQVIGGSSAASMVENISRVD
jgi:hypothetical protein